MRRRTLLKLLGLLPWIGPTIAKALTQAEPAPVRRYGPYLPASFPRWDKAVDGLSDAGIWGANIERTRLPRDFLVPKVGEMWESIRDCEVNFRLRRGQPYRSKAFKEFAGKCGTKTRLLLFGGKIQLRQGEQIRIVCVDDLAKPLVVTFEPLRYDELQEVLVPEEMRRMPDYEGYELSVKSARTIAYVSKRDTQAYFIESFKLVA